MTDPRDSENKENMTLNGTTEYEHTISNTQESKLVVANEKSPMILIQSDENYNSTSSNPPLEIYFSCHERMVNGNYMDSEQTLFKHNSLIDFSSIRDSREICTMPELNRSTLMDQIDYDLDNYKINESSMISNSIDHSKHSIPKHQFMRAKESIDIAEEVRPKFMGFLNEHQEK